MTTREPTLIVLSTDNPDIRSVFLWSAWCDIAYAYPAEAFRRIATPSVVGLLCTTCAVVPCRCKYLHGARRAFHPWALNPHRLGDAP